MTKEHHQLHRSGDDFIQYVATSAISLVQLEDILRRIPALSQSRQVTPLPTVVQLLLDSPLVLRLEAAEATVQIQDSPHVGQIRPGAVPQNTDNATPEDDEE